MTTLRVPAEFRAGLHRWAVSLSDDERGAVLVPGYGEAFGRLATDLAGHGATTVTAPPAVLWMVLKDYLADAGGEVHELAEKSMPWRDAFHGRFAAIDWCLDALDAVAALEMRAR